MTINSTNKKISHISLKCVPYSNRPQKSKLKKDNVRKLTREEIQLIIDEVMG